MITIGICIPSYQRGLITRESILHIYTNNKKVFDEGLCHFYISDDCSRDDTFKILSNLNEEIKCITIPRRQNIIWGLRGIMDAVYKCVKKIMLGC